MTTEHAPTAFPTYAIARFRRSRPTLHVPGDDAHEDQVVAREQLSACDDDEDQTEGERDTHEPPRGSDTERGSGRHGGGQDGAERDERRCDEREHEGRDRRCLRLRHTAGLHEGRDLAGRECIVSRHRVRGGSVHRHIMEHLCSSGSW
jgi:hypothetical protein